MTHKTCTRCGEVKPLDGFGRHGTGKYGKNPVCRECNRQVSLLMCPHFDEEEK